MTAQPIRLEALGVPVTPRAAKILLHRSPWQHIHAMLVQMGAPADSIQELQRTWTGLETIAALADQYGYDAAPEPGPEPTEEAPMTAVEAAEILGVTERRVREMAAQGLLIRAAVPGDRRVHLDPESVRDYAVRRVARAA